MRVKNLEDRRIASYYIEYRFLMFYSFISFEIKVTIRSNNCILLENTNLFHIIKNFYFIATSLRQITLSF